MQSDYVIELDNVCCKAGYRYLLQDINWKVKQGEHWVVFGMNGSGKTTLLSIIAGFKHFTAGRLNLFDDSYSNANILDIRKRIGWVSSSFFDQYYAKESALNIVLSGKHGTLGLDMDLNLTDVLLAKELLEKLDLGDRCNYSFDMLSKGERQNVLIARALFSKPDILILDEPCSGLDIYNRNYLFHTLKELGEKKAITIIYVTHYVEEIIPMFDKALFLKNGRMIAQGATNELFCQDVLEDMLGCSIEINQDEDELYKLKIQAQSSLTDLLV